MYASSGSDMFSTDVAEVGSVPQDAVDAPHAVVVVVAFVLESIEKAVLGDERREN